MNVIVSMLVAFGMYFSSYSGSLYELHKRPYEEDSFRYSILGGYTEFSVPYTRLSLRSGGYVFHLFALTSGKIPETDEQGNVIGNVYYNGIIVSAGRTVYRDSLSFIYIEPGIYLETTDGWYNPGVGLNLLYRRMIYDKINGELRLNNIGFSLNPKEPIDFDGVFAISYFRYGFDPFFSVNISPERGIDYYFGFSIPLHKTFSADVSYTNAHREFKFGSGADLLNGLSIGIRLKTSFLKLIYAADFHGEGGISHAVEIEFSK